MIFWSSFIINWKWDRDSFLISAIFFGKPHLCSAQFPFGYLHSSVVTSYKAGRLDVVPHAVLQIFCQFQSRVGKILIMAININVVRVPADEARLGPVWLDAALPLLSRLSMSGLPDLIMTHSVFLQRRKMHSTPIFITQIFNQWFMFYLNFITIIDAILIGFIKTVTVILKYSIQFPHWFLLEWECLRRDGSQEPDLPRPPSASCLFCLSFCSC